MEYTDAGPSVENTRVTELLINSWRRARRDDFLPRCWAITRWWRCDQTPARITPVEVLQEPDRLCGAGQLQRGRLAAVRSGRRRLARLLRARSQPRALDRPPRAHPPRAPTHRPRQRRALNWWSAATIATCPIEPPTAPGAAQPNPTRHQPAPAPHPNPHRIELPEASAAKSATHCEEPVAHGGGDGDVRWGGGVRGGLSAGGPGRVRTGGWRSGTGSRSHIVRDSYSSTSSRPPHQLGPRWRRASHRRRTPISAAPAARRRTRVSRTSLAVAETTSTTSADTSGRRHWQRVVLQQTRAGSG